MRDDLDGCLCAQGAAQKNAATRTDNDSKEVWGKKTHLLSREPGDGFSCAWAAPEEPEHCYWPGFVLPEKEEADEGASKLFVCKYCGMPSYLEPIDQTPPSDYCHESDHGYPI